jgi:hypothetical protein
MPDNEHHQGPGAAGVLPTFMMVLVALAAITGILLLLPAGMIIHYFPHWRVMALLGVAMLLLAVPIVYAWRTRPF